LNSDVVVEHGDPLGLGDEIGRVRVGHGRDELHDGLFHRCLMPARQLITAHLSALLGAAVAW
jgi:hypothetical protein